MTDEDEDPIARRLRRAQVWRCPGSLGSSLQLWHSYVPDSDGPPQPCVGCDGWDWQHPTWELAMSAVNRWLEDA